MTPGYFSVTSKRIGMSTAPYLALGRLRKAAQRRLVAGGEAGDIGRIGSHVPGVPCRRQPLSAHWRAPLAAVTTVGNAPRAVPDLGPH